MNKTEAKKHIKDYGIYTALDTLASNNYNEVYDLIEIMMRVFDNIPSDTLKKAVNKATR